jgi:hypothetical protein
LVTREHVWEGPLADGNIHMRKGPVAETVKNETAKTENELRGLHDAKTVPTETAATGQALTCESLSSFMVAVISQSQSQQSY